jgi:hypothetical protein
MKAQIGERLLFHGKKVGSADHTAEVLQVRGDDGSPPYLVRFGDGQERLIFPGTDCQVLHGKDPESGSSAT